MMIGRNVVERNVVEPDKRQAMVRDNGWSMMTQPRHFRCTQEDFEQERSTGSGTAREVCTQRRFRG